jgi:hypothetical protein
MRNFNLQLSILLNDKAIAAVEGQLALYAHPPVIDSRFTPHMNSNEQCYDRSMSEIIYDIDGNEVHEELTEGDKVIIVDM